VFINQSSYGCTFFDAHRPKVRIYPDGGSERIVVHSAGKQLSRGANVPRYIATGIYDRVPATAFEGAQISLAVSAQSFELWKELRIVEAAVEERDLVLASERGFDEMPAQENSSPKD
jgi:hypothetical protein